MACQTLVIVQHALFTYLQKFITQILYFLQFHSQSEVVPTES
jgi:hypothetical protein